MTKKGILTNGDFTKNEKFDKIIFKVWQKLKEDDKTGMSIIVGFTKMTFLCETGEFDKNWDNETKKQAYWQFAIFTKMANLRKWELSKNTSTVWKKLKEMTKRGILTKGKFRQKIHQGFGQIFKWDDKKGHVGSWRFLGQWQILRRWRIWQEVIKGLTKIYKEMTKRGILTNGDYNKNGKLGNISFKVCQNSNEMTNEACR